MNTIDTDLPHSEALHSVREPRGWEVALGGLWRALVFPEKFFAGELRPAYAVVPLLALVFLKVVLVRLQAPFVIEAILRALPADVAARIAQDPNRLLAGRIWTQYLGAFIMPVIAVSATACLLYLISVSLGHLGRFSGYFVTASYSWLIYGLQGAFSFVLLRLRGLAAITGPESLSPPVGLGLLFPAASTAMRASIDTVNIFEIWFLVILTVAVQRSEKLGLRTALAIAGGSWLVLQAFRLGGIILFSSIAG
jgi:hypothetical protein